MIRLGVLGSTRGTHLRVLIEAIKSQQLAASIAVVISNKPHASILERAQAAAIPTLFSDPQGLTREQYDAQVSRILHTYQVDLIVLMGYMRILSDAFVAEWENRIINVHPSLLPAFAGMMDLDVHRAVIEGGVSETGCTVHYVTSIVDAGPVLLQQRCEVLADDSPQSLKARVQSLEGNALVEAIKLHIIKK